MTIRCIPNGPGRYKRIGRRRCRSKKQEIQPLVSSKEKTRQNTGQPAVMVGFTRYAGIIEELDPVDLGHEDHLEQVAQARRQALGLPPGVV